MPLNRVRRWFRPRNIIEASFGVLILAFLAVSTYSTWAVNSSLRDVTGANTERIQDLEAVNKVRDERLQVIESRLSGVESKAPKQAISVVLPKSEPTYLVPQPPEKKHWWEK